MKKEDAVAYYTFKSQAYSFDLPALNKAIVNSEKWAKNSAHPALFLSLAASAHYEIFMVLSARNMPKTRIHFH